LLIRDRDGRYPALLDTILVDTGIEVVLSGVQMPRTVMERWIQGCRHELLDRTLIWNQAYLLHALHQHELHDNAHRPHQGISNTRPPAPATRTDHQPGAVEDNRRGDPRTLRDVYLAGRHNCAVRPCRRAARHVRLHTPAARSSSPPRPSMLCHVGASTSRFRHTYRSCHESGSNHPDATVRGSAQARTKRSLKPMGKIL
jgi:hypothetical protein